jgi:hypothetical protein
MSELANEHLLDDRIKKNSDHKSEILHRVTEAADGKEFKREQQQNYQTSNMTAERTQHPDQDVRYNPVKENEDNTASSSANKETIMGLSKPVFYASAAIVLAIAGYFTYTKFFKAKPITT